MKMRKLLRRMALELHVRGSTKLARDVMAEADGYPEADRLPEVVDEEGGVDSTIPTSDIRNLPYPPYTD